MTLNPKTVQHTRNYLNSSSQEPKKHQAAGWYSAQSYDPGQLAEKGLPEGGFIILKILEYIPVEE